MSYLPSVRLLFPSPFHPCAVRRYSLFNNSPRRVSYATFSAYTPYGFIIIIIAFLSFLSSPTIVSVFVRTLLILTVQFKFPLFGSLFFFFCSTLCINLVGEKLVVRTHANENIFLHVRSVQRWTDEQPILGHSPTLAIRRDRPPNSARTRFLDATSYPETHETFTPRTFY